MESVIIIRDIIVPIHENVFVSYQVKATAENVDEAVRELPDANLVRYSFHSVLAFVNSLCLYYGLKEHKYLLFLFINC